MTAPVNNNLSTLVDLMQNDTLLVAHKDAMLGSPMHLGTPFSPTIDRVHCGREPVSTGGIINRQKPSLAEIIAFGGIPKTVVADVRSSDRVRAQPSTDNTQLERAMDLVQRCDEGKGKNLNLTFPYCLFRILIL